MLHLSQGCQAPFVISFPANARSSMLRRVAVPEKPSADRTLAPHVRSAVARVIQARLQGAAKRPASHVLAAVGSVVQAKQAASRTVIQRAAAPAAAPATSWFWHCATCGEEVDYGSDRADAVMPAWPCGEGHINWVAGRAPAGAGAGAVGAGAGAGAAPAAAAAAPAAAAAVNDEGLSSTSYLYNGRRWSEKISCEQPGRGGGFHAEQLAYLQGLVAAQRQGWIGFVQNGAPCPGKCRPYFEGESRKAGISGFIFHITGDKGGYNANYGSPATPFNLYIVNGNTTLVAPAGAPPAPG